MCVKDVKDRSNTPKSCNAMYVEDVEDGKRTYTHILAHNFKILCMLKHVEDVEDYLWHLRHALIYTALSLSFPKFFSDWKSIKY